MKVKAKVNIVNWITGSVIYESKKATTIKEAVVEANLRGANLREADLREANLYGANLREADLREANLREADLREADLYGANLREANLREADLYGANLREADLREANLREADLREADLYGANLRGADLYGANLDNLPKDWVNLCSRDMLFIFQHLKKELPGLRKALVEGRIDGSQYEGECACLIGTLANVDGGIDKVCEAIPFYDKGTHNPGEQWFLNIRKGDTPKNNEFSKHAVMLIDTILKPRKPKAIKK